MGYQMLRRFGLSLLFAVSALVLAACDSAEERAEGHYQKGLELLEAGDVDRALVEFRNVFKLNGFHRDARWTYAQVVEGQGDVQQAYSQLLRLIEQYPDDTESRVALTRMAMDLGNWDEAERHVDVAKNLAPQDPIVASALIALDYRAALQDQDLASATTAALAAAELVAASPDLFSIRRIVIDNRVRQQDWPGALVSVDGALALRDDDLQLHSLRLGILEQLGDAVEIEAHLRRMTELFPENDDVNSSLIRWYVSRGDTDAAEAYLRSRIDTETHDNAPYTALISFLAQTKGMDAALDEVTAILAVDGVDQQFFRSVRAGFDFDLGNRDAAIAEMEAILDGAEPNEQTHTIKIMLANMLIQTENAVGARALVEEVLAEDTTQVAALKLKANWLIDDDETGDAIVELRRALDQAPRDAEIMTLLARAYERAGNRELMAEMLALAVEASGNGPAEALRYARLLLEEGRSSSAEQVLIDALRLQQQNLDLLGALGALYIQDEDWSRTDQVINTLDRFGTDGAATIAKELTARKLAGQNRENDLVSHLNTLMEDGQLQAGASVIRLRLAQGDAEGALNYAQELLQQDPDNPSLQFIEALVLAANGQVETAVSRFRAILEVVPEGENVWLALYNLHRSEGAFDAARAALEEGLQALPEATGLNWALASEREIEGDVEGAIEVYERLYAADTNSRAFANNLASLISSYRTDTESIQRAYTIARRLRGTEFPPYQDTYGWIAHLLGNHDEALSYLEPAAEAIPEDPLVRYHLGAVYAALDRAEEAQAEFEAALTLIEERGIRTEARSKIETALATLLAPAPETVDN